MSEIANEMKSAIVKIAGPCTWNTNRKRWLHDAALRAGISDRAAFGLFYLEYQNPSAKLVDKIRAAASRVMDEK